MTVEGLATPRAATPEQTDVAVRFARWTKRLTILGWISCAALVALGVWTGVLTSVPRLRAFLEDFGVWAPLVYTLVSASQSVVPVLPGGITVIAAPILFGPVVGSISSYVGTCLGSFVVFAISRHVGRPLLEEMFHRRSVRRYLGWLDHPHFTAYFAAAIALPVAPDDLLCYLAGLTKMRVRTYVLIILLLKPWSILAYSFGVIAVLQRWLPWLGV